MKKFMIIWIGELISCIGSGMTAFALSVYVFQLSGSVSMVSLVTLLAYMPTILLSPLGGLLADRYDRRLMMILGDLLSGLGLVYILISICSGSNSVVPILAGVTINAVFVALLEPSYKATVTDLLTEEEYAKASGMVQLAGNAKYLISPALAGVILAVADIKVILILDIATFFITVSAVAVVRKTLQRKVKTEKKQSFAAEFKEGMTAIVTNKGILSLVAVMALLCFFIGFIQTLTAPMVLSFCDAKTAGFLESLSAVGMVVGSMFIGFVGIKKNHASILFGAALLCGLFMALVGVRQNVFAIGVTLFLFFTTLPFMNTCADVLLRVSIPNELQGRVWGMVSLLTQAGTVIAYISCGVLADHVFEPLLAEDGALADSLGRVIGTGAGRGIGFMLIIAGIAMGISAFVICRNKAVRSIQCEKKL